MLRSTPFSLVPLAFGVALLPGGCGKPCSCMGATESPQPQAAK